MSRTRILVIASTLLLPVGARSAQAQFASLSAYSTCAGPDSLYVHWTTIESPPDPSYRPDWVGYDVLRRPLGSCGGYERVNPEIIPRIAGETHSAYFGELLTGTAVDHRVVPVDADRQQLFINGGFCFSLSCWTYTSCPVLSSPITIGRLEELAPGFVYVISCPGTCYPAPFFSGGVPTELLPYVGTSATFAFYGTVGCGGVEGCFFDPDQWQAATCVTPAITRSWGRLKTIYR